MSYYLNLSVLSNNLKKIQNIQKTEHKKRLSAEAWRILSQCEGRTLTNEDIAREAGGRPFLPGSDTDFSISHSGDLAAVSLVRGKGLRTGCDVELVRPRPKAREIAEEFFTAPEREYIESGGGFDLTRFYQIWTLKECLLKLRGLSVFDMNGTPSFINDAESRFRGTFREQFKIDVVGVSPVLFNLYELTGAGDERYIAATAIAGGEERQPEIRWFSRDSLAVCKIK
jgi:phosphopantetheinyl transferase